MPQESIEDKLKSIKRWHFIPGKNKILPVLGTILGNNEYIIDVIDGFFPGSTGKEDSGLMLVTDKTVVLIKSEFPDRYVALKNDSIKEIKFEKTFSSLKLKIESGNSQYSFITHLTVNAVKNIFTAAGKQVENESSASNIPLPVASESFSIEQSGVNIMQPGVSDLLYSEVKKISIKLDEFKKSIPDRKFLEMYRDDIYTISGMCGMSERKLSDNEMLFICMVLSAGEYNTPDGTANFLDEIIKCDSFPHHLGDVVNRRMDNIISGIEKMHDSAGRRLKSLEFLLGYDLEHNTMFADRMASLFYEYSQCLLKADGVIDGSDEERLKNISDLIRNTKLTEIPTTEQTPEQEESIEQVMEKINELVGMDNIKDEIKSFINFVNIRNEREKRNLPVTPLTLHAVFYGPPGTGKTTIARLLGRAYKALGLLKSGHLVETDRAGLVAGYVGQTAIKTDELVTRAKSGVLFIDEAYTLIPENSSGDFGKESVDTILKRMEDMRDGFAVIAAGYTDEMERFINSNPGLKSRFSRYFYFNHYTPDELVKIFNIFAGNIEFKLNGEADEKLRELITYFHGKRTKSFGNARFVRNVFDKIVQNQADRLAKLTTLTNEILCEVTGDDIPAKDDFIAESFS